MDDLKWYQLLDTSHVISPSLFVYPKRIEKNIRTMIKMAGGTDYLRPHIKTHKMAEIVKMQMDYGIRKFKCATIAEAELLAQCNAQDILLAMQPVGANMFRFLSLMENYPNSRFSTLIDNTATLDGLISLAKSKNKVISLWLDINNGMDRTGIEVGKDAIKLYKTLFESPYIESKGLHVYDGHIRNKDLKERKKACNMAFEPVLNLKKQLEEKGHDPIGVVAGGSPTFPIHSKRTNIESSPGTTLLWDERYEDLFKEMEFVTASVLLTRLISKPGKNLLCFDLGHKSIAPEMDFPRVRLFGLEDCEQIGQSEEHLVVECHHTDDYSVGDVFYAIPMHICPTVAKYETVQTVENNKITGSWKVAARNYKINI